MFLSDADKEYVRKDALDLRVTCSQVVRTRLHAFGFRFVFLLLNSLESIKWLLYLATLPCMYVCVFYI